MMIKTVFFIFILFFSLETFSQEEDRLLFDNGGPVNYRIPKYRYTYIDREHETRETLAHLGIIYGVTWAIYPITQPSTFRNYGSWDNYKRNFGKLVLDQDEPFWNWFAHPMTGGQLFLYYRANGYSRIHSLAMSFVSSTLFEFTVEVYTEPASGQDLYQTPILGSVVGMGIEMVSLYLLNTGNAFATVLGHVINPTTLFWFYEGKIKFIPQYNKNGGQIVMMVDF